MIQQFSCGDTIAGRVDAAPECFRVGKLETWQPQKGCVQMQHESTQKCYAVTSNYTFYLYGHVNYTNFSEDYQYHGQVMPSPKPADYQLTLYRKAAVRGVDALQRGDVVLNEERICELVKSVQPLQVKQDVVSTETLCTGDVYGQWHKWLLTHVVNVDLSHVHYDTAISG